ncbi:MAG: NADH:flavin oxidoreductase [Gammaproteobacteria bacterium]|jgi:2,4-dienoyl-CoA reductase-like NADH-dependent reductase (Old Yellow Enzyme family)
MNSLFSSLTFNRGPAMKNRFMLAPLTNQQSHEDGVCSDDEYNWLTKRAEGGFGLTMTCAAHVQPEGKGFPGQLGIFSDAHLPGLTRLAQTIKSNGSLAIVQLYHGGMRCPQDCIGMPPLCPSDNEKWGARAMTTAEVKGMIEAFISAAERAERAGFDGVELHGAHGYILAQFISAEVNQRDDQFGGSLANRQRPMLEIIHGIRERCGSDFMIGVRLSPERFGMKLDEVVSLAEMLMREELIEFLDMSMWDVFKMPEDGAEEGKSLLSYFTELDRKGVRLGVAGKLRTPAEMQRAMDEGVDWIMLGRAAILHHDYPTRLSADAEFVPVDLPVSLEHLLTEGLSETFVDYMKNWKGFVKGNDGFVDNDVILNS